MSATGNATAEKSLVEGEGLSMKRSPNESRPEDWLAEGEAVKNHVPEEDSDGDGATSADGETSPGNLVDSTVDQGQLQPAEGASHPDDYDEQYERERASQLARQPSRLGSTSVFSPDSSDEEDAENSSVPDERRPSSIQDEEQLRDRYMARIMEEKVDGDPTKTIEVTSAQKTGKNNIPRKRSQLGLSAGRNDLLTEDLVVPDPNVSPPWKQGQLLRRSPGPLKEVSQEFLRALRAKANEQFIEVRQEGKEPKDPLYADQHELHDMINGWVAEVAKLRGEKGILEEEIYRLQSTLRAWEDAHQRLTADLGNSQAAVANLNQLYFDLTRECDEADNRITELSIDNDGLHATIADLELKLQKASRDCDDHQRQPSGAQSQARSESRPNPACEDCPKLQQEIARLHEEINQLRAAMASQPSTSINTNPEFQKRSEELAEEIEQLQQDLARERGITTGLKEQQTFALALSSSRQGEKWPSETKRAIAQTIVDCMRQANSANPRTNIEEIIALLHENLDIEEIAEWLDRRRYQFKPSTLFRQILFSGNAFNLGLVAAYLSIRGFLHDRAMPVSLTEYIDLHEALRIEWNENFRHIRNDLENAESKRNDAVERLQEIERYADNLEELELIKDLFKTNPDLANELAESKRLIRDQKAEIKIMRKNSDQDTQHARKRNWDIHTLQKQKDDLEKKLKEAEQGGSSNHTSMQVKSSEELAERSSQLQQSNQQLQAVTQEAEALRLQLKILESSTVKGSQDGKKDTRDAALKEDELNLLRGELKYAEDRAQEKYELCEKYKRDIRDLQKRLQALEDEHSRCGPSGGQPGEAEQSGLIQTLKFQLSEHEVELAKLRSQVGSGSSGATADIKECTAERIRLDENLKIAMANIAELNRQLVERENHVKVAMVRIMHSAADSNERHSQLAEHYRLAMASIAELNQQRQDIYNENQRLVQEHRALSVEYDRVIADIATLEAEREEFLADHENASSQENQDTTETERLRTELTASLARTEEVASLISSMARAHEERTVHLVSQIKSLTSAKEELTEKLHAARDDEAQDRESLNNQIAVLDRENRDLKNARGTVNGQLAFLDRDNRELQHTLDRTESRNAAESRQRQLELQQANERLAEVELENARLVSEIASQQQTRDVSGLDTGNSRRAPGTGLTGSTLSIPHYIAIRPAQRTVNLDTAIRGWDARCNGRQTESDANNPFATIAAYLREHHAVEPSTSKSKLWSQAESRRPIYGAVA